MGAYEEIIAEQRAAQQRELETARKRLFLLKARDLGAHRKHLLAAWSERRAAIETEPEDEK